VTDFTSAAVPPVSPDDNVRGDGPEAILYLDLGCPHCAATWVRVRELPLRLVFRHFPVASKHSRAPALHAAAEAAGAQGRFFEMVDSLYEERGRVDDPHLWERVERLGLDLDRFERERRSDAVAARVRRDFQGGVRGGVTATPIAFAGGRVITADLEAELARLA
jgi:protein-disulfide isomerase